MFPLTGDYRTPALNPYYSTESGYMASVPKLLLEEAKPRFFPNQGSLDWKRGI